MIKYRIVKIQHGPTVYYEIQQRHHIFFWWWVPAWVNSIQGASAPQDRFETLKEAQDNLYKFDGTKPVKSIVQ